MSTKIKDVNFFRATSKLSKPIADATHDISEIAFLIAEITLENGIVGQGYVLTFHYSPRAIVGALHDLKDLLIGCHANETVKFRQAIENEHEYFGHEGVQRSAAATVNLAMWDAWGKTLGQPIHKILGTCTEKVNVYGSGGWLSYSDDELVEEVSDYKARGFKAVKIKVGAKEEGRDLHRLSKVREAVGNDIKIMMDANQGMDLQSSIKLSNEAKHLNIHWFEEPVVHNDFAAYEILRQKTSISLAMGEREYSIEALKELIRRNALDLWQPDVIRIGGVENWLESASLANAYNIPVLPHYYKDYDIPLLCTIPNGYGVESFDWIDGIIDNQIEIVDGFAVPRQTPGWGFSFLHHYMEEV